MTQSMIHPEYVAQYHMAILNTCVEACFNCAQTCLRCADACLGEKALDELRHCIRINLDCADICYVTGRVIARQTTSDSPVLEAQLDACLTTCHVCGETCAQHGESYEHCKICASVCFHCEDTCKQLFALSVN
jgi:hypothetical protein